MAARFTMTQAHYEAFGRQVLCAPWMQTEMLRRAEAGRANAEAIAPRRSGRWASSFATSVHVRPASGRYTRRAVGRLYSTDPDGMAKELGTAETPAHRTLGRSLPAMRRG